MDFRGTQGPAIDTVAERSLRRVSANGVLDVQNPGEWRVHRYTRDALAIVRAKTNDETVPIHVIGGIANNASTAEVRGFVRAAVTFDAWGASLYDFPITSGNQWAQLQRFN